MARTCTRPSVSAPLNYSAAGSAQNILERLGIRSANRRPLPTFSPSLSAAHQIPMVPPLPTPESQLYLTEDGSSDRGSTRKWPHEISP